MRHFLQCHTLTQSRLINLCLVVLFSALLSLLGLDQEPWNKNEPSTLLGMVSDYRLFFGTSHVNRFSDQGILYTLILKLWQKFFGNSVFCLRLLSALSFILASTALYLLIRKIDGSLAWISTSLFITNSSIVLYSQHLRAYSLVVALSILVVWLYIYWCETQKPIILTVLMLVGTSAVFIQYIFLPCLLLLLFLIHSRLRLFNKKKILTAFYITSAAAAICIIDKGVAIFEYRFILRQSSADSKIDFSAIFIQYSDLFISKELCSAFKAPFCGISYLPIAILIASLGIFNLSRFFQSNFRAPALLLMFCPLLALMTLQYLGLHEIEGRYFCTLIPFYCLTMGSGLLYFKCRALRFLLFFLLVAPQIQLIVKDKYLQRYTDITLPVKFILEIVKPVRNDFRLCTAPDWMIFNLQAAWQNSVSMTLPWKTCDTSGSEANKYLLNFMEYKVVNDNQILQQGAVPIMEWENLSNDIELYKSH